ncbi:GIN domain-containing protein [Flavobacterium psychrotolerans]|uniref:DUF2807 domain-containing protein n=1 Tax=Flavobacterium psychrotolerans TaxID=2169410 RepID=A0A2U1JQ41_9FLAO|nr:DUF2807 domain-containing protein [Flavobacterium psychrotolerans]PWA07296.1 DUF2807 domain-containing protein [Flavobacterium psychrotolerans]
MKNTILLFTLLLFGYSVFSQEKIKGSKIVTVEKKETKEFDNLEADGNLELFLIKGDKCGIEIEADDNLHDIIEINQNGSTLQLSSTKEVKKAKKFSVRITYTDDFKMAVVKNKTTITALEEMVLNDFTFKSFNDAKIFANVKTKKFTLFANDKSKIELNSKSAETTIELSQNAQMKALISSEKLTIDMYQKTTATVEGDAVNLKLRLDNNAEFTGRKLTSKNAEITTEENANCSIVVDTKASINASGKSEIQLFGTPKIELTNFTDSAILYKKPLK